MIVFLSWNNIAKLLEKYPELKERLRKYDFEKIKKDMEEASDRIDFGLYERTDALLGEIQKDLSECQNKMPEFSQERADMNILTRIILEENISFVKRFSKRRRLSKD